MRGLRGYILNLADGQGPPTGTVDVSAKPSAKPVNVTDAVELDLAIHRLGALTVRHQPGSASKYKADQAGHFGWDMELSPGPIDVRVTPHDPQIEYRRRFPDESAQMGKAFLTDLERLGWAGGKDGLIWDAVFGGYGSSPAFMTDPTVSVGQGNWAFGGGGTGPLAGWVSVRAGIAMLAGTVFSVEMVQGLWVPVDGEPVMDPNTSSNDRWDLLCLRTDWNPASPEYGKQSFEFIKGTPSATMLLPDYPGNTGNYRRLPLWAVKMKANTSTYDSSTGYDLRSWLNPPAGVVGDITTNAVSFTTTHFTTSGVRPSNINTNLATSEIFLHPRYAWDGLVTWYGQLYQVEPQCEFYLLPTTEGRQSPGGPIADATNYCLLPPNSAGGASYPLHLPMDPVSNVSVYDNLVSVPIPIRRIPAGRNWHRLRLQFSFGLFGPMGDSYGTIRHQIVTMKFWPAA